MMTSKAHAFQRACRVHASESIHLSKSRCAFPARSYATRNSLGGASNSTAGLKRRAITVTSDDGRYNWSELSTGEKAARTTQQSFNFLFVTAGALGTVAVAYLLYTELFAADSKTRQFNQAADRIKADAKCRELLGPAKEITAFGEPTSNKWARARPLAHTSEVDRFGTTHFRMHFHMAGPKGEGTVNIHMTKRQDQDELEYRLLSLSVPGHQTVYLENKDAKPTSTVKKMFGVQWR